MTTMSAVMMAHPSRRQFVAELQGQLGRPLDVVWDRKGDRWDTGRRAMLAHDPAADWHLVLQDDAVPCRDLIAGIERACGAATAAGHHGPIAFYAGCQRPASVQVQAQTLIDQARRRGAAWMRMEGPWWGVAIALPVDQIADMLAWGDQRDEPASPDYIANYDKRISRYYASQGIDCWYSVPSLVDHREVSENPSLVPGRTGNRQAHLFHGADRSALDIDWDRHPEEASMATHRNTKTGNTIHVVAGTALAKAVEKSREWEPVEAQYGVDTPADQAPVGPASEPDVSPEPSEPVAETTEPDQSDDAPADDDPWHGLDDLTRDELNDRATEAGVEDAAKLPNKGAVVEAIQEAEAAVETVA